MRQLERVGTLPNGDGVYRPAEASLGASGLRGRAAKQFAAARRCVVFAREQRARFGAERAAGTVAGFVAKARRHVREGRRLLALAHGRVTPAAS